MSEIFTVMKWPLIASLILPWLLVYLGLHIVQRGVIFVDLALAQTAAFGTCVSMLVGYDVHDWQSYAFSLGFTFVGAVVLTFTRTRRQRVPQEALIGIVYVMAAAAAILVLSHSTGGKEELQRSLVGELLEALKKAPPLDGLWATATVSRDSVSVLLSSFSASQPTGRYIDISITGLPWSGPTAATARRIDADHSSADVAAPVEVAGSHVHVALPAQAVALVELHPAAATAAVRSAGGTLPATGEWSGWSALGLVLVAVGRLARRAS